jgi:hypothetical protein
VFCLLPVRDMLCSAALEAKDRKAAEKAHKKKLASFGLFCSPCTVDQHDTYDRMLFPYRAQYLVEDRGTYVGYKESDKSLRRLLVGDMIRFRLNLGFAEHKIFDFVRNHIFIGPS